MIKKFKKIKITSSKFNPIGISGVIVGTFVFDSFLSLVLDFDIVIGHEKLWTNHRQEKKMFRK